MTLAEQKSACALSRPVIIGDGEILIVPGLTASAGRQMLERDAPRIRVDITSLDRASGGSSVVSGSASFLEKQ